VHLLVSNLTWLKTIFLLRINYILAEVFFFTYHERLTHLYKGVVPVFFDIFRKGNLLRNVKVFFSSLCQRQSEIFPSLGGRRPLTFHILIFSSKATCIFCP
jgi:hypothetical protein